MMEARDLIAILVIVGAMILLYLGHNGIIATSLLAVVAFYFGAETLEKRRREISVDNH